MKSRMFSFAFGLLGLALLASPVEGQTVGLFDRVGIGAPPPNPPGERLQVEGGNILLNSTTEQALTVRRYTLDPDPKQPFRKGPAFSLGRLIIGGDGSPNFRVIYSETADGKFVERTVLALDEKGIVASVKNGERGSHFEGFLKNGDAQPAFRLNSFPEMQLEFGSGGDSPTDVSIRRCGRRCLDASGSLVADEFVVRSSSKLKDEIAPLSQADALQALAELNPVTFVLKGDESKNRRVGFLAEELPSLVSIQGKEGASPMQIVALLAKMVQVQQKRIESLERTLAGRAPGER